MNWILGAITSLDQHFDEIANGGDAYRPANWHLEPSTTQRVSSKSLSQRNQRNIHPL
jgi:hypothetical protein